MRLQEWGSATWCLFHTLSFKLKNSHTTYANDLLKLFIGICNNLPCPMCRREAVTMLKDSNTNLVTTRSDLIRFMWQFHNLVNQKLGKPEFTFDAHNEKYEKINTNDVVKHYIYVMSKKTKITNAMADTLARQRNMRNFITFMQNNNHRFDP